MNCTAFGLMTAVPILFIHAFLQTKTTELIDSLEMASVKFLNAITERQTPGARPPRLISRFRQLADRHAPGPTPPRSSRATRASRQSCCSCR